MIGKKIGMINSKKLISISFGFIFLLALFSRWTENYAIWKLVFLMIFTTWFSFNKFRRAFFKIVLNKYTFIYFGLMMISIFQGISNKYTIDNILLAIWPIIFITFIVTLYFMMPDHVLKILNKAWIPLNIIYVLNLVIITIQCSGYPLLIKKSWIEYNSFYPDLCCGLFGLNGTHEFTLFAIFMNIYILSKLLNNRCKKSIVIYYIITDILLLYLSTQNDNASIFLILPMFIAIYLLLRIHFNGERVSITLTRILKISIPIIILAIIVINIPFVKRYIEEYVYIRIKMAFRITDARYQINGSNERLAIFLNALSSSRGWLFGWGVGSANLGGGNFFNFAHFGLSSIGSFTMTGGIWYFLSYALYIMRSTRYFIKSKVKFDGYAVIIFISMIVMTIYTILFTSFVSMIWFSLIFLYIGLNRRFYIERARLKE